MERVLARIARRWSDWNRTVREHPVRPTLSERELATRLAVYDFEQPRPLEEMVEDVADVLEHGSLHATHPRYFGLFVPGVRAAGVAGDALAAVYNSQLGSWWHGAAAAHVERQTLAFFRARIGLPDSAFACFTTGGSEANLTGVLAALAARFPRHPEEGLDGVRPVFYASDQAHDSLVKIARTAGLGARAVRRVRSDAAQRLDVEALERMIASDRAQGDSPFLVVATVGATATGAIDPLGRIADLCAREGLWMHADAAWGGIALLSKRLRQYASGIERADSVTWDAHKTLPVPMGAGMFFVRDRRHTEAVFSVRTAYVPDAQPDTLDAYQQTIQWSRRFIGLKVFLTLAELGREGVERIVDGQAAMADLLRQSLRASGWTIMNDTLLPVVCFCDGDASPSRTTALVRDVVEEGTAWISEVRLPDERRWLRACITHADVGPADVRALVDALDRARAGLTREAT
ncbi:MAG: pyridoxal-dependent decarboxylase [Vicinamibacterales bacterium]